jgi:hypothetical protein
MPGRQRYICPVPVVWGQTWEALNRIWEMDFGRKSSPPPSLPPLDFERAPQLLLSGGWQSTVDWAEAHGCADLLPIPTGQNKYFEADDKWLDRLRRRRFKDGTPAAGV